MATYRNEKNKEIAFPLGGIGSGCVSLAGNGGLVDWEVQNRPNKGSLNGHTHFAIKAERDGRCMDARILNGDLYQGFIGQYQHELGHKGFGYGVDSKRMAGFPHFSECEFTGEYPLATLQFGDWTEVDAGGRFPGRVSMTAFNPLIPGNSDDSSIPGAFFEIAVENDQPESLRYSVAFSLANLCSAGQVNKFSQENGISQMRLYQNILPPDDPAYGELCMATDAAEVSYQEYWYRGIWRDHLETYWRNFTEQPHLVNRTYDTPGEGDTATLCASALLAPGESKSFRFVLTWHFPNNYNYWNPYQKDGRDVTWKNYYAVLFENASSSAHYSLQNWDRLYGQTLQFHDALFASTVPDCVLDAVSANLSTLKTPTVLRLEDGSLYGWEGTQELAGSCEGSCTHVWNYAYAVPFLFPDLERSMRDLDYRYNMTDNGAMQFRLQLPLERGVGQAYPCLDGQMGGIIKSYREWKISGDDEWLKKNWPAIKKSLAYAWEPTNENRWDTNHDGVLEGRCHHTLDMNLFGPSSWLEGFYLAALKAAAEMADYLGETEQAGEYRELFAKGKQWMEQNLFNGSYYIQKIDLADKSILESFTGGEEGDQQALQKELNMYWNEETKEIKYQIGEGSSIDQVLAQWHANLCGLGEIFDPEHLRTALLSLYRNNFKQSMRDFYNPWRVFGCNDEAGTVICDYPDGAYKPTIPVPYCQETMHGFEYALAALMIQEGMVEEGTALVRAVRDKYDGAKRNPWNEIECGNHYARSMASFSLLNAFSGFSFDMARGKLGFAPVICPDGGFCTFWSLDAAWGTLELTESGFCLSVLSGTLPLTQLDLPEVSEKMMLELDSTPFTDYKTKGGSLLFAQEIKIYHSLRGVTK